MRKESFPVTLARNSLQYYLSHHKIMPVPLELPEKAQRAAGVFVSLKKDGELKGCIGTFAPTQENVAAEIIHNAISAGTRDPRFPAVKASELPEMDISVDILSPAEPVDEMTQLDPKIYGIIIRCDQRSGLLLPDLDGVDTVDQQIAIAMQKAGIHAGEEVEMFRFTVTRYK
ncbi:MAG TPA: AmmeMemoRadiSam system protein A [Patescibacteria group bacterium]|nr:AmmeMemoRadiSam system protein A [Patescibacteria group bacterium]